MARAPGAQTRTSPKIQWQISDIQKDAVRHRTPHYLFSVPTRTNEKMAMPRMRITLRTLVTSFCCCCICLVALPTNFAAAALSITVLNNGGPETLVLCAAKRAATRGHTTSFITSDSNPSIPKRQLRLLYGNGGDKNDDDDIPGEDGTTPPENRVEMVSQPADIAKAIGEADSFIVTAHDSPVDVDILKSVFGYSSDSLKRVVLLSKMGASASGGGGFLGGGGGKFKDAEDKLRLLLSDRKIPLTIVRCGTLKGGGPGHSNLGGKEEGFEDEEDTGLDRYLYDTNLDLTGAMTTMQHDRFTLGLPEDFVKGDPNKLPNGFVQRGLKDYTGPSPTETNSCVAAVAATAAAEMCGEEYTGNYEFSLGCEKGEVLPTVESVIVKLEQMA